MTTATSDRLVWIDLEMTGLNPDTDSILEIATLVTDNALNELAVGPVLAIRHESGVLEHMDDWNRKHHRQSGLWERALDSYVDHAEAETLTLAFLADWCVAGTSPICGNSICQDRRFLFRQMPDLEAWFHYRNLDVSTVKELASRWCPDIMAGLVKASRHEALSDIRESVAELRYYRQFMGRLAGNA